MIVVNTETIPGKKIVEIKGLVQGNTVRAKNVGYLVFPQSAQ